MSIVIQRQFSNNCKKLDFYISKIPFLKTIKSKVDIHDDTLSRELDEMTLIFNIFKAMKYLANDDSILFIDLVDFSI